MLWNTIPKTEKKHNMLHFLHIFFSEDLLLYVVFCADYC